MGFDGVGLAGFCFEALGLEGLGVDCFVGVAPVLSGVVTVLVLVLGGGETKPSWSVTGTRVPSRGVGVVPWFSLIV